MFTELISLIMIIHSIFFYYVKTCFALTFVPIFVKKLCLNWSIFTMSSFRRKLNKRICCQALGQNTIQYD